MGCAISEGLHGILIYWAMFTVWCMLFDSNHF